MTPAVHRRFWAIFMLSLLLHGGVFWWTAASRSPKRTALPPLIASLRSAAAATTPFAAVAAPPHVSPVAQAAEVAPKVRRASPHPVAVSAPAALPPAGPANAIAAAPASAHPPSTSGATEAHAKVSSEPVAATPAVRAEAQPARPAGEALEGYRQRLASLLAGIQDYPRVAAMRGWEGEVRLRLKIARKGNLLGVVLDRSSGYDVLDRHALAMLEGRSDLPPLPEALEVSEIQVIVPINYKLRKTT